MWAAIKGDATTKSTLYLLDAEHQLASMKLVHSTGESGYGIHWQVCLLLDLWKGIWITSGLCGSLRMRRKFCRHQVTDQSVFGPFSSLNMSTCDWTLWHWPKGLDETWEGKGAAEWNGMELVTQSDEHVSGWFSGIFLVTCDLPAIFVKLNSYLQQCCWRGKSSSTGAHVHELLYQCGWWNLRSKWVKQGCFVTFVEDTLVRSI